EKLMLVCSVFRGDRRLAPVEAPDQLAADGLNVFVRVQAEAGRSDTRGVDQGETISAVIVPAILGLPIQARKEPERILVAGTDEVTAVGVPVDGEERWSSADIREIDLVVPRLCSAKRHVSEELRQSHPADPAAGGPRRAQLLVADDGAVGCIAADAGPIV